MEQGEIILYQPDETVKLEVRMKDETVWLTQAQMEILFRMNKRPVSMAINNVFKDDELDYDENVRVGENGEEKLYSLDVVISVGYRVKSIKGTPFRKWAYNILKERWVNEHVIEKKTAGKAKVEEIQFEKAQQLSNNKIGERTESLPVEDVTHCIEVIENPMPELENSHSENKGIKKTKIPVKQALPMVAEMIKFTYLASTFGKASSWIYNKLNHENTTTTSKGFNQSDINILNDAISQIGEKLLKTRISAPESSNQDDFANGDTIVRQLKSLSKVVSMPFIYIDKLEKNRKWYVNRTSSPERYRFKEEELTIINMAIVEIGNKLLSIELTL